MRVHTTKRYAQTNETDQVVFDTLAQLLASDEPSKDYMSGTLGFVTGAGEPEQGNYYVLSRESVLAPNGTTILQANEGGNWLLLGAVNATPGSLVMFSAGVQPEGGAVEVYGPNAQGALAVASGLSFVAPRNGTVKFLRFRMEAANGGQNTLTGPIPCSVYVNGVVTAVTVAVPAGDGSNNVDVADLTHGVAVVGGDLVQLVVDFGNAVGALTNFSISALLA